MLLCSFAAPLKVYCRNTQWQISCIIKTAGRKLTYRKKRNHLITLDLNLWSTVHDLFKMKLKVQKLFFFKIFLDFFAYFLKSCFIKEIQV